MINTIVVDFFRVLLFPQDNKYQGSINDLHDRLKNNSDYQINQHFILNTELMEFLDGIKENCDLYVFTSGDIQNEPKLLDKLKTTFKHIFTTQEIGYPKNNPAAYEVLLRKIGKEPEQVLFIDDNEANINAAQQAGLATIRYTFNLELFEALGMLMFDFLQ